MALMDYALISKGIFQFVCARGTRLWSSFIFIFVWVCVGLACPLTTSGFFLIGISIKWKGRVDGLKIVL